MAGINWLSRKNLLPQHKIAAPRSIVLSGLFRTTPGPRLPIPKPKPRVTKGDIEDDYRAPLSSSVEFKAEQGYKIIQHKGKWLDQGDFDVLLKLLDMCYRKGVADEFLRNFTIAFTGRDFLRSIDRAEGGSGLASLKQTFHRLWLARVEIVSPNGVIFEGSFIEQVLDSKKDKTFGVILKSECGKLFEDGTWTKITFQQRLAIKSDLAKWLYCEFSSHEHPIPRDWDALARWSGRIEQSGRKNQTKKKFIEDLRIALKEVAAATGWKCWYVSTGPYADKVFCNKISTTTRIQKASSAGAHLNKQDEFLLRNKNKLLKLDTQISRWEKLLTPFQAGAAEALSTIAAAPSGVSGSEEQHPLKVRELWLEVHLYLLGQRSLYPKLREHIKAAQAALMSGMPATSSV